MFRFLQIKGVLGLSEGQFKDCELNISYHQPLMYELFEEEFLFNLSLRTLRSDNDEMCMLFASTTLERGNSVLCLTEVGDRPSQLSNWVRFLSIARLPPFTQQYDINRGDVSYFNQSVPTTCYYTLSVILNQILVLLLLS